MLKKVMALAATTAMLGVNAAAYALTTARAAVKSVTGSPAGEREDSGTKVGTSIQPSIPPMPATPERPARKAATRAGRTKGASAHKIAAAKGATRKKKNLK